MAQDTSMAIADSITEQYAGVMDDLIADCTRLEDKNADLQRQLAVALQVRNAAIVARDQARRERDEAHTRAHEGDVGDSPTKPIGRWQPLSIRSFGFG